MKKIAAVIAFACAYVLGWWYLIPDNNVLGASNKVTYAPDMFPITDAIYDLGTTTKAWRTLTVNQICLTGDSCETSWPTGGSISLSPWATTTSSVAGQLNVYPLNTTDILNIGGTGTTTSRFWVDPNTSTAVLNGANTASVFSVGSPNNEWSLGTSDADKSFRIASSSNQIENVNAAFAISKTGYVGIGTSSPYAKLSVAGDLVAGVVTATTSTSTFAGITTTGLAITGNGTTTAANGFNITAGCYAVNGICLTSGGGGTWGSITGTLSNQTDLQNELNLKINNSTTTLPLIGSLTGLGNIGSSSATTTFAGNLTVNTGLNVLSNGYVGINNVTSPQSPLSVKGNVTFGVNGSGNYPGGTISTSAGMVTLSSATAAAVRLATAGSSVRLYIASDGKVGVATQTPYALFHVYTPNTSTGNAFVVANGASTTLMSILDNGTASLKGNVGIGTTSPAWPLQIVSSSSPQLTLSDTTAGVGMKHWTMRSSGGVFYLATSTDSTYATSSAASIVVNSNGYVGIGIAVPTQALEVNGGVRLNTATAQPTCSTDTRGLFWVVQNGAGVKDDVQVCAKDAADAMAWRTIY